MLHPPIAEVFNPLPIIAFLVVFWATVAVVGISGSLLFLVGATVVAVLIQRRWLGEAGPPGPPAPDGLPWGHQQAARMVARRRALRRSREVEAAPDPAPD